MEVTVIRKWTHGLERILTSQFEVIKLSAPKSERGWHGVEWTNQE